MAMGYAHILSSRLSSIVQHQLAATEIDTEIARFDAAVAESRRQITKLLADSPLNAELNAIFGVQILLLKDPMLIGESREKIRLRQVNAEWALEDELCKLREFLLQISDPVFQERVTDLEDIGSRILCNLLGETVPQTAVLHANALFANKNKPCILLARKIMPSLFLSLPLEHVEGIVCQEGGVSDHLAILARDYDIPTLVQVTGLFVGKDDEQARIAAQTPLLLDCQTGVLQMHPDMSQKITYHDYLLNKVEKQNFYINSPVKTTGGDAIEIWTNLDDIESATDERVQALSGVGLFRTEFLYLKQPELLNTAQEHNFIYTQILKGLRGTCVHFRLLDVGRDKNLPYHIPVSHKQLQGIRFLLANRNLLQLQLRSILIAAAECAYPDGQCRILLPMVTSLHEIEAVRTELSAIREEIQTCMALHVPHIGLGVMIETPAAIEMVDIFANVVDFLCIGSNDLTCLNAALERDITLINANAELFYQPAFYRQIRRLLTKVPHLPILMCGVIASQSPLIALLLGLGIRKLSISLSTLEGVSQTLSQIEIGKCQELAAKALQTHTHIELQALVEESLHCK